MILTHHNLVSNIISSHETLISFIGETADDKISQDFDKLVDNAEDPLANKEDKGKLTIVFKISTYMLFIKIYIYLFIYIILSFNAHYFLHYLL